MVLLLSGMGGLVVFLFCVVVALLLQAGKKPSVSETTRDRTEQPGDPEVEPARTPAPEPTAVIRPTTPSLPPAPVAVVPTFSSPAAPAPASGSRSGALATVQKVKDATVYVIVKAGKVGGTGSGFVVQNQGNTTLIATNRHVVSPHRSPEAMQHQDPKGIVLQVSVVFRSGQGPGQEQSLPAEIVAVDNAEGLDHDLAILAVRGVRQPPTPINVTARVALVETMRYTAFGFPFGDFTKSLGSVGNPSVTVTSGTISALRKDEHGRLVAVQLDGSLQPGNSGGPLVDEEGRLIGVAVAKLAAADTIGLAIPGAELTQVLAGRVGAMDLVLNDPVGPDAASLDLKAQVVDPLSKIQAISVRAVSATSASGIAPNPDGSWPPLPGANDVPLQMDQHEASGHLQVALRGQGPGGRDILIQATYRDRSGRLIHSSPRRVRLPGRAGPIVTGSKLQEMKTALARKSLARLDSLVDPDHACQFAKDEATHSVRIDLPEKLLSLSPVVTRAGKPIHNAPMSLTDVDGDFLIGVEVSGKLNPGLDPPKDPKGHKLPFAFQGAGLIVYQNRTNYLRLERACMAEKGALLRELLVEVVRDGNVVDHYYIGLPGDPSSPIDLLIVRQAGRVRCLFSPDGKTLVGLRDLAVPFPEKVRVGLTASNVSKVPFAARFDDFILLQDKDALAGGLGDTE